MGAAPPRAIPAIDRRRLLAYLTPLCPRRRYTALRARALLVVTWSAGLRLGELARLNIEDIAEEPNDARLRLRSAFYLRPSQAKGGERGAGMIFLSDAAREALLAYLREAERRGYVAGPRWRGPLWITLQGAAGVGHHRMSHRALEAEFRRVQERAGLRAPFYRFHDLRHTACSRYYEVTRDIRETQRLARHRKLATTERYVHLSEERLRSTIATMKAG